MRNLRSKKNIDFEFRATNFSPLMQALDRPEDHGEAGGGRYEIRQYLSVWDLFFTKYRTVRLYLSGVDGQTFRGFLVQARNIGEI